MNQEKLSQDGFSSDQQDKQQQILIAKKRTLESPTKLRQQVRRKIPPASQIKNKAAYSLRPDIETGWIPRILLPKPIPILFKSTIVDKIVLQLLKKTNTRNYQIIYLGARYQNSYFMHYGKKYMFPYHHIKKPNSIKQTNRQFIGNRKGHEGIQFNSLIESGNLDCSIKISQNQYDLFILVDTNTQGHMQWYNFKVSKAQKGKTYTFNICNLQKSKSLYSRGMKPYIFSKKKYEFNHLGWEQCGDNLKYDKRPLRYQFLSSYQQQKFHRLSFQYTFQYDQDQIQIAYCIPYQYTYLLNFIQQIISRNRKFNCHFLKVTKLTSSLGGLDIPLLTIHQYQNQQNNHSAYLKLAQKNKFNVIQQQKLKPKKKCIVISCRAHPGQSNGSHMLHGFLEFICGFSQFATYLRKNIIFKIVPMLNPDGVVQGNYRTGLIGKDFNRQFLKPDKLLFPQNWALKNLIKQLKRQYEKNLLLFLDFHGHSVKKNSFMYGPQFSIMDKFYYETKIFPKLLSLKTDIFRFHSCIFKVSEAKQTTARAIVLKKLDISFSYTIEVSNGSFYDIKLMKDINFNLASWNQLGRNIGLSLYDYCYGLLSMQEVKLQKLKQRRKKLKAYRQREGFIQNIRSLKSPKQSDKSKILRHSISYQKSNEIQLDYSKFRCLIDQMKKQEQSKNKIKKNQQINQNSISEGSSDFQQGDDLDHQIAQKLYKIIKSKETVEQVIDYKLESLNSKQYNSLEHELIEDPSIKQFQQKQTLPIIQQIYSNRYNQQNHKKQFKYKLIDTIKQQLKQPTLKVKNISFSIPSRFQQKLSSDKREKNMDIGRSPKINNMVNLIDDLRKKYGINDELQFNSLNNMTFYSRKLRKDRKQHKFDINSIEGRRQINLSNTDLIT